MDQPQRSLDILGIGPVAKAIEKVTTASVDGAAALLSRICLPAAEEFGLLLRDRVQSWRAANITRLTAITEQQLKTTGAGPDVHAHPRVVSKILEEASWSDDATVLEMWAGLLTSACSEDGQDDSNLILIRLLSAMSRVQARLLNFACEHAEKLLSPGGLMDATTLRVTLDELHVVTGESDLHRLDTEMDDLRGLGLISLLSGFSGRGPAIDADVTPTALALYMYARCKGFRGSPAEFYGLAPVPQISPL